MRFLHKKNPEIYLSEITQYVTDLQRITLLRDKARESEERDDYDNIIHCMQEVLIFMNSINVKDRKRNSNLQQFPDPAPVEPLRNNSQT